MADGVDWEESAAAVLQALARPTADRDSSAHSVASGPVVQEGSAAVSKCWGKQLSPLTRCALDFSPGKNHFARALRLEPMPCVAAAPARRL